MPPRGGENCYLRGKYKLGVVRDADVPEVEQMVSSELRANFSFASFRIAQLPDRP
jgi:hypothetical protein